MPRYAHLGVRRRVYGAYLVFYRLDEAAVTILHVLHAAKDYDVILAADALA